MKAVSNMGLLFCCLFLLLCLSPAANAADYPKEPITIKLEGAKMAPVVFSHGVHAGDQKIDCVKCHHKDPQAPKACTTCHGSEAKGSQPAAKDAFHTRCQTCHKEMAAKGSKAPTKCVDCHKK
ncbi:MAG TPA: cytochrome c3 family protein [Syntrophorhabdales bacterium]|nr:cytochrome c3 family protein [Syntrophorhabdales bacterium]